MRDNAIAQMASMAGNEDEEGSGKDDLDKEMLLCVCGRIFSNPCSLCCGHTMCKECILKNRFVCTTCGETTIASESTLSVNVLLHSIVAKLYPKHCEVERLKSVAKEKEEEGDLEAALEKLSLAMTISPKDVTVLNARSSILTKLDRYHEAKFDSLLAIDLAPTNGYSHFYLGGALSGLKQLDEAIEAYQTCLEHSFDDPDLMAAVSTQMDLLLSCDPEESESVDTETSTKRKHELNSNEQTSFSQSKKLPFGSLAKTSISLDDVRCSLCLEFLFQPVTTSCGHSFCKSCLMRWIDYKAVCPHCRTPQSDIVSQQSVDVTTAIEKFLAEHFPVQYSQMQADHKEKQAQLARVGSDSSVPVPILVCMVAFPELPCPLNIFEPKYRGMLRECIESGSNRFGTCAQTKDGYSDTGTILKVVDVKYSDDGKAIVTTIGENRFKIINTTTREDGLMSAFVDYITDDWEKIDANDIKKVEETCISAYSKLCKYFDSLKPDAKECITRALGDMPELDCKVANNPNATKWLWWAIAALPLHESLKIRFLKSTSFLDRIGSIDRYLHSLIKRAPR